MNKRVLETLKIVEINGEPVTREIIAPSVPVSRPESVDLIAQLKKNIETLEDLEFRFSYLLNEVKTHI